MRNVILTAVREFKATAMTKAFIVGVVVLPAVVYAVLGVAFASGLFDEKPEPLVGTIAVIDTTPDQSLAPAIARRFNPDFIKHDREEQKKARERAIARIQADFPVAAAAGSPEAISEQTEAALPPPPEVTVESLAADTDLEAQKQRVRHGDLLALTVVGLDGLKPTDDAKFQVFFNENLKARFRDEIGDTVGEAIVDRRYTEAEIDRSLVRTIAERPRAESTAVTATGETKSNDVFLRLMPVIFMVLLFTAIFTGAQYLMMSTIEEKSSRVMEVLLSAVSPLQLMTGKIVGQGLVGLLTIVIYGGVGLLAAKQFNVLDQIPLSIILWQVVYFLMGYFMFAAIMASIGAAVTEIREAQALQGPVLGIIILVFYLAVFLGFSNPHSIITQILSFIPPFMPLVMSMRVSQIGDPVPLWQMIATTIVGLAGMIVFTWAAAKIFRLGVLMYGKPPTLMGMIKWLRYS